MEPLIFALVLLAALLHASWNALVKVGGDALVRIAIVNTVSGVCGLAMWPFVEAPAPESWPYLAGSVAVHQAYYLFLISGYRVGDLSHVYPIARGVAPALVAVGAFAFAGETLSAAGVLAVVIICGGILSLSLSGRWRNDSARPVVFALCTGVTIAAYTLLDGIGGRLAGDVLGYIAYLFAIEAVPVTLLALYRRRHAFGPTLHASWRAGTTGGALAFLAYGLVIWAMSMTPMTYVSALRETSVIMAAFIGTRLLKEPYGTQRIAAASIVAFGVIMLQWSRAG